MSTGNLGRLFLAVGLMFLAATATAQNAVRFSELHYDNSGTDTGEAIEISAPAGTDLTNWQIVLYNGNGGAAYDSRTLSGVVPATCGERGVFLVDYPENGIQNGSPDGVALVDETGTLLEFLSYEGTFAATDGPAVGVTSVDIGVSENGTEPVGQSLALGDDGTWTGPAANTFGACNGDVQAPAAIVMVSLVPSADSIAVGSSRSFAASAIDTDGQPVAGVDYTWTSSNQSVASVSPQGMALGLAAGDTTITATAPNGVSGSASLHVTALTFPAPSDFHVNEIHYDNAGVDTGEFVEIEGPAGAPLAGYQIVLYNGNGGVPYGTTSLSGTLPASCGTRGVVVATYPQDGIQNGSPDGVALVANDGTVLDFISYEGAFAATSGPAAGFTSRDILVSQASAAIGMTLQRDATSGTWSVAASTQGGCNDGTSVPPANSLSFSGRNASDPALPVGFEDQLFATLHGPSNETIPATIAWSSDTPAIATVDANGVVHALAAGTAVLRATADDGTTGTWSLPTRVAVAGTSANYGNNAEFGEPGDGDPSDDFIVRHEQYTASYNPNRGAPNWVAYDLDATHFGAEDRCDCFTADPSLPATFPHLTTNDYTGAGAAAGYGIDRGHLARSFDRTSGSLDNARTFYFDNIVPQAADLNQGPWAALESDLGDLARVQDKEVYILTGAFGNKGTLKNEGRIVIPTFAWKVALILPRDRGLADVHDYRDVEVIAVLMPNEPGIRNVPWQTYETTVDQIEALSGYDLLALLPDGVEAAVESSTQPPLAQASGPGAAIAEGSAAAFSAAGSVDPNGSIVSYVWEFGDGSSGSGATASHVYAQDGAYSARLTITDNDGLTASAVVPVTVTNVAPALNAIADGNVDLGASYTVAGSFADPGADQWTVTVDWGDGSAPGTVSTATRSFSLSHTYAEAASYTVRVTVADDDTSVSRTHAVTVTAPSAPGLSEAFKLIDKLVADRKITKGVGLVLKAEVDAARKLIAKGNTRGAMTVLRCLVSELDFLVRLRVVKAADVAPLRTLLISVYQSHR
jgi:DNA/RNA endonuclease G (NUC1)